MCSQGADFADVRECSPASKSLVALEIRSLANGVRTCGPGLGVKGPQVQILSSRRETAGQRPFRTKPEAASLLPCSHWCSHGTRSHRPIAAESRWTAKRAPSVETWPYTSPVTATKECPSSSETVCTGTPAASMCVANECLSVCRPTPSMPKALAAVLIARSALLGSTAVPLSLVKTRPADSALERPRTKDVRWATSPFDAPVQVNAAGGVCGNWARPGSSGDRASRGRSADVPQLGRRTVDKTRPHMLVMPR
jgi:hypothetical protein